MARWRQRAAPVDGDVLPRDLTVLGVRVASVGLFDAFTIRCPDGRLGLDPALAAVQQEEQREYSRLLRSWCGSKGIDMAFHARDSRFEGLLDRSRMFWRL